MVITNNSYLENMDTTDMVPPPKISRSSQMNVAMSSAAEMNSPSSGKLLGLFQRLSINVFVFLIFGSFVYDLKIFHNLGKKSLTEVMLLFW